jgi:uncharacterized protein YbgA (DUF1722 family)/uncharacterized protein YbbK (DUF523 family)
VSRAAEPKPRIGVSACLLGQKVRYDGGHKRNDFLTRELARHVEYVPVCPETAIGLGIPRPPIRLVGSWDSPRVLGVADSSVDVTGRLLAYAESQVSALDGISGFVLKKDSPSCGMERVKVFNPADGSTVNRGTGAFAKVLMEKLPLLPVADEERLDDPVLRENLICRIYVYRRWQQLRADGLTPVGLIAFHTTHKYLVMAHSQAAYRRLGKLLGDLAGDRIDDIAETYIAELMPALKRPADRSRHVNVLQHVMGYLKKRIGGQDKERLLAVIQSYHRGETPLAVPITLLRHYFSNHPDDYISRQYYLTPYPESLGLRKGI